MKKKIIALIATLLPTSTIVTAILAVVFVLMAIVIAVGAIASLGVFFIGGSTDGVLCAAGRECSKETDPAAYKTTTVEIEQVYITAEMNEPPLPQIPLTDEGYIRHVWRGVSAVIAVAPRDKLPVESVAVGGDGRLAVDHDRLSLRSAKFNAGYTPPSTTAMLECLEVVKSKSETREGVALIEVESAVVSPDRTIQVGTEEWLCAWRLIDTLQISTAGRPLTISVGKEERQEILDNCSQMIASEVELSPVDWVSRIFGSFVSPRTVISPGVQTAVCMSTITYTARVYRKPPPAWRPPEGTCACIAGCSSPPVVSDTVQITTTVPVSATVPTMYCAVEMARWGMEYALAGAIINRPTTPKEADVPVTVDNGTQVLLRDGDSAAIETGAKVYCAASGTTDYIVVGSSGVEVECVHLGLTP